MVRGQGDGTVGGFLVSGAGRDVFDWLGWEGLRMLLCPPLPHYFAPVPGLGGWGGVPLPRLQGGGDLLEETASPGSREEWGRRRRWG